MKKSVTFKIIGGTAIFMLLLINISCQKVEPDEENFTNNIYVYDRDGVWSFDENGNRSFIQTSSNHDVLYTNIDIYNNNLYVHTKWDISVYDLTGNLIKNISISNDVSYPLQMTVLPNEEFALCDNKNDVIYFIDNSGSLKKTVSMSVPLNPLYQNVSGIVVNNKLIISEDGFQRVIKIDLNNYDVSVFKDFRHLEGLWIGAMDYFDGNYYICQSQKIYAFKPNETERLICTLPTHNNTGIAVKGDYALVTSNFGNRIYKVNLNTGNYEVFIDDVNYPSDIAHVK